MNHVVRVAATSLLAASLLVALGACKKIDKDAATADGAAAATAATDAAPALDIKGLKTEKQQAGYAIGLQVGSSLEEIKDEIDFDSMVKAMRSKVDGTDPLMTEEQARTVFEAFGQRMQAKMAAEAGKKATANLAEGAAFLAGNAKVEGVQVTASGLQYQVLQPGTGAKPGPDDRVSVHYKGALLDGTTFDSSYDRGEPATFQLSQVVPGWNEGLQLMPVGSKYKLWIPASLGYGEAGTPGGPIAPNSTLVFEVELLEILGAPAE
ncbi:FKBP-type peptidyl-prolyl cis-trans isomerase [Luteimonas sp. MC1782]|uniref:FKBP-type peptidyl-prolyl cis-trans isomerase n=1 Tax=Luteimonas sp. MC1782 TaxID=2760305 RepID=UPI001600AAC5|nr:FKBP-type peptidyl-prolyl cis-trans isomerase [Luteimonas sp. MC1782]MBB1471892.1 FKBP-type peptidyl-prolyl cis-trans isomerase [Luteimonas sp. MC1782]